MGKWDIFNLLFQCCILTCFKAMLQLKFILELPKLLGLKTEKLIGELLWSFVYTINLCFRLPVEKDQI